VRLRREILDTSPDAMYPWREMNISTCPYLSLPTYMNGVKQYYAPKGQAECNN